MHQLEEQTLEFIKSQGLDLAGCRILVALSGGLDSVSLLNFCLKVIKPVYRCRIFAAHVNHGLRKESLRDKFFVENLCTKLGVTLFSEDLQTESISAKESLEDWGRKNRYRFFEDVCQKNRIHHVFTAHHLNDQLETLYMRLDRGTGLRGLRGIHFRRDPNIIRPFLSLSRKVIKKYAFELALEWKEDVTNTDTRFRRNLIRQKIQLGNLSGKEADLNSAGNISLVANRICSEMTAWLDNFIDQTPEGLCQVTQANFQLVSALGPDFCYELLAAVLTRKGLSLRNSSFREFMNQSEKHPERVKIQINKGYQLVLDNKGLSLIPLNFKGGGKNAKYVNISIELKPENTEFKGNCMGRDIELKAKRYPKLPGFSPVINGGNRVTLDGGLFSSKLIIRTRKTGDKFSPLGARSKTKKLKKYLIDKKFTNQQKDNQLLICSDNSVAWLPDVEISDTFKVTSGTSEILELEVKC